MTVLCPTLLLIPENPDFLKVVSAGSSLLGPLFSKSFLVQMCRRVRQHKFLYHGLSNILRNIIFFCVHPESLQAYQCVATLH